jgi:hypothetical protein
MPVPRRPIRLSIGLAALAVLSTQAVSSAPPPAGAGEGSSWKAGRRITLEMSEEGAGSARYTFENAANGDFRIEESETLEHGVKRSGTVLMVAGRGMAVRGLDLPKDEEFGVLDGPFLRLELVRTLLERAVPAGPASVKEPVKVEMREASRAIQVETPTAGAGFLPPWRVTGSVTRASAEEVAVDLSFQSAISSQGTAAVAYHFKGTWELGAPAASLPDDTPLAGWTSYLLGPVPQSDDEGEGYALGARRAPTPYPTVGALRKAAQASP